PDGTAGRYQELALLAADLTAPNAASRGYRALVAAELARATGEADVTAWQAAVGAWGAGGRGVPVGVGGLRGCRGGRARGGAPGVAGGWRGGGGGGRRPVVFYPLAYAWLRLAEVAAAAGDRQAAGRSVRRAHALASRVGVVPIAAEAAALARRTRLSLDDP